MLTRPGTTAAFESTTVVDYSSFEPEPGPNLRLNGYGEVAMVIQWNAEKYPPLGRCLYGTGSEHEGDLSDEHIFPFALLPKGGDRFLPKASCAACADVTKRFEGVVCGAMFGPLRQQIGLKSRRKKSDAISVRYNYPDGSLVDKEVNVFDFPQVCMGYRWPIPGIVMGVSPTAEVRHELVVKYDKATMQKACHGQTGA